MCELRGIIYVKRLKHCLAHLSAFQMLLARSIITAVTITIMIMIILPAAKRGHSDSYFLPEEKSVDFMQQSTRIRF